ncbi:formylmethanofuran--tetrahydromethanopterin N-formyltransferase [Gimesia chilikensis]|uniref:formylmethanofuran--tetrahydromethanopterin N-formyltransferase n=1 Tax=Gimesia chilikensis TaxID=2605989 RepID=UPI001188B429|nr:formylmethanofuran--tetrahydromethanopterin N-formyltransferase [Gimesia chilikensis]MCR9231684.1 formylmethanofuran--tetrahydromethanopterin N-formyltransferase [bacterium]QDT86186.1 Formyltransferase/hydrolase complex subunit D [Gimesia chilikensis]
MNTQPELAWNDVPVCNTFAEAFTTVGTRIIVTAVSESWVRIAATEVTGYATSVIACDAEAGVEKFLSPEESPDGRPGVSLMFFAFSRSALEKAVTNRVGQCILTCPTTACYAGIPVTDPEKALALGKQLRFFGDGFQISKKWEDRRLWRIPVMDGEFVCEDRVGSFKGVAGGNLLICATNQSAGLLATEAAVTAMQAVDNVILPFPGGIVRSGSKVGSKYSALKASTNDAYCPTLRAETNSDLPEGTGCVYEIVIDGETFDDVQQAMCDGLQAATQLPGLLQITAGNYGGKLGKHHFHLAEVIAELKRR